MSNYHSLLKILPSFSFKYLPITYILSEYFDTKAFLTSASLLCRMREIQILNGAPREPNPRNISLRQKIMEQKARLYFSTLLTPPVRNSTFSSARRRTTLVTQIEACNVVANTKFAHRCNFSMKNADLLRDGNEQ